MGHQTSHLALATLSGHESTITSILFLRRQDDATGSGDNTVKLWDSASHRELATLQGHASLVSSVAFSPDGRMIATGSADKTVKLWDSASHQEITTLKGHTDDVRSVVFSGDGTLASASADGTVKLWDSTSHRLLGTLEGHKDDVTSVVFSPDGKRLATSSFDTTVKIWDAVAQTELASLKDTPRCPFRSVYGCRRLPTGGAIRVTLDASIIGTGTLRHTRHCLSMRFLPMAGHWRLAAKIRRFDYGVGLRMRKWLVGRNPRGSNETGIVAFIACVIVVVRTEAATAFAAVTALEQES